MTDVLEPGHELDFDRIDEIPNEQGCYDNGWQLVFIWCRTHGRREWRWVDYDRLLKAAGRPLDEFLARR
jgi:hypothetical protein